MGTLFGRGALALLIGLLTMASNAQTLQTRWAAGVTPENVHREYPRPQMVRKNWVNLNGLWDFAIVNAKSSSEPKFDRQILVPFPIESQLSRVRASVSPTQMAVYRRTFTRPKGDRVLLHFGAVDWATKVLVNGKEVGTHTGGYDGFSFDITDFLTQKGEQTLVVEVTDPTDSNYIPRGKQVRKPGGIFYTSTTGIWQTVWLEPVPMEYIHDFKIEAATVQGQLKVSAFVKKPFETPMKVEILRSGQVLASGSISGLLNGVDASLNGTAVLNITNPHLWTPEDPYLYDLRVTLLDRAGKKVVDQVTSYCAFRELSLIKGKDGQPRFALNGKPYFMVGPLDQGFWPDGLYTAPSDEALKYDIEVTKRLGFNMIRKHVKVEPERWYYWCDKLGIAVFQDMPSGDGFIGPNDPDINRTEESAENFKKELKALIDGRFNHPCIVSWVLYNEGWGQWDTKPMAKWLKDYDPTRLLDAVTGWSDRGVGDMHDVHVYPGPGSPGPDKNRALFLGEFGGLGLPVPGHMWLEKGWGYQSFKTSPELTDRFVDIFDGLRYLIGSPGLSGAVYTQTSDVETELNGLMTYDRAMIKMDEARVRRAIHALFLPAPTPEEVSSTSERGAMVWHYRFDAPAGDWMRLASPGLDWNVGPGGFGTEETPGAIVRTLWNTPDIYLRINLDLPEAIPANEVRLRLSHDDDVQVYLDGEKVYEAKGWTTSYSNHRLPSSLKTLAKGKHVLAIHCHQNSGGQYIDAGFVRYREGK